MSIALAWLLATHAPTVTFDGCGLPTRLIPELAKATGQPLLVAPNMNREALVIHVKDAPIQTVLDKVAQVSSAQWVEDPQGKRLVADNQARTKERQTHLVLREADLQRQMDLYGALLKKYPEVTAEFVGHIYAEEGVDLPLFPTARAAYRFLQQIDPKKLAAMEPGQRLAFASSPTQMQSPLPGFGQVMSQLMREQTAFVTELNAYLKKHPSSTKEEQEPSKMWSKPIARCLLIVAAPTDSATAWSIAIRFFDADGSILDQDGFELRDGLTDAIMGDKSKETKSPGKSLKLDPAANEVFNRLIEESDYAFGSLGPRPSPELVNRLLQPDVYDPASLLVAPALTALTEERNEQLIANVGDDVIGTVMSAPSQSLLTEEGFWDALCSEEKTVVDEKDGWMTVQPRDPYEARFGRMDRTAYRTLLDCRKSYALVPLLAESTFFTSLTRQYSISISDPCRAMLSREFGLGPASRATDSQWNVMRLWAKLTPDQRQALSGGGKVALRNLSDGAMTEVQQLIYGTDGGLKSAWDEASSGAVGDATAAAQRQYVDGGGSQDEPTELLPTGLPRDGWLEGKAMTRPVLRMAQPPFLQELSAASLGAILYAKEDPTFGRSVGLGDLGDGYLVGIASDIFIKFVLTPKLSTGQYVSDNQIPIDAKATNYADLPADIRAIAEKSRDNQRKAAERRRNSPPTIPPKAR